MICDLKVGDLCQGRPLAGALVLEDLKKLGLPILGQIVETGRKIDM
jgi:hypothetical protein